MTEIFGGTPQFYSWYANRTLHCMLIMQPCQKSTSKLFGKKKNNSSERVRNLFTMLPSEHKFIQKKNSTSVPCCTIPTVHFPSNYLLHIPTFLPCYNPTFTRRTSGHCLRTFRAVNLPHSPPPSYKCSASHGIPVSSSTPSIFCQA